MKQYLASIGSAIGERLMVLAVITFLMWAVDILWIWALSDWTHFVFLVFILQGATYFIGGIVFAIIDPVLKALGRLAFKSEGNTAPERTES